MRAPNYKGIGDKGILEKKAPANPKFAAVQSTLDTGSRWRDDLTFTRPKRKNEYFGYAQAPAPPPRPRRRQPRRPRCDSPPSSTPDLKLFR